MFAGAQRQSFLCLALVGAWVLGSMAEAAATVPQLATSRRPDVAISSGVPAPHFVLPPLTNDQDASFPATSGAATSPGPSQSQTEPIYDPLPPALWSASSMLALGGAVASFRSLRRRLR